MSILLKVKKSFDMIQFFAPDIEATGSLPPDESRHCSKVLRHRAGDTICVIDGKGKRLTCEILDPDPRSTQVRIISAEQIENHWIPKITIAVAPTKNIDRIEWMIEKCVEIGIDRIVPILCEHSERKVVKHDRLANIAVSAMKQSLKTRLPEIMPLTPIADFLHTFGKSSGYEAFRGMGYCDAKYPRKFLLSEYKAGKDAIILIGPEGDFSPHEVEVAVNEGFIPVTFGNSRLRTETAAIVALDTIHFINRLNVL